MDAIKGLFSAQPGLERVNIWGLIVMALAVALLALAGPISKRFAGEKAQTMKILIKFCALIICIAGFLIAVM